MFLLIKTWMWSFPEKLGYPQFSSIDKWIIPYSTNQPFLGYSQFRTPPYSQRANVPTTNGSKVEPKCVTKSRQLGIPGG